MVQAKLISPTGTDPDRTNPQTFCFASTLCPNAEGAKTYLVLIFSFLDYVAPVIQVFPFGRALSFWGVPNLASRGTLGCIGIYIVQRLNSSLYEDSGAELLSYRARFHPSIY